MPFRSGHTTAKNNNNNYDNTGWNKRSNKISKILTKQDSSTQTSRGQNLKVKRSMLLLKPAESKHKQSESKHPSRVQRNHRSRACSAPTPTSAHDDFSVQNNPKFHREDGVKGTKQTEPFRLKAGLSSSHGQSFSYSLDLLGHHHGVLFADLGGGIGPVVVRTVVLVGVPVDPAEQVPTATIKTCKMSKS